MGASIHIPSSIERTFPEVRYQLKESENGECAVMLSNIRSILNKHDELEAFISLHNPGIVALTETWLTEDVGNAELSITGYNLFRADRAAGRGGGGVMFYIKTCYPTTILSTSQDPEGFYESLWCRVKVSHGCPKTIGVLYRSPGARPPLMLEDLNKFMNGDHFLLLGDFNMPNVDWETCSMSSKDSFTEEVCTSIFDQGLFQHVRSSTRVLDEQSSTLDLILSPRETDMERIEYMAPLGRSDHLVLLARWKTSTPFTQIIKSRPNVWRIPFDDMRREVERVQWIGDDVQTLWSNFKDTLCQLTDKFAPVQYTRRHARGPPWFDKELRSALKRRNRLWQRFRTTGEGYTLYKIERNSCTSLKINKRRTYEERLSVESVTAPKRLYAYLKRRTRAPSGIPSLVALNETAETVDDKADMLAKQYSSVYAVAQDDSLSFSVLDSRMDFTSFSETEVLTELTRLNAQKSPGPDNLHPLVLKRLADIICVPLTRLFNISVQEGRLPYEWKQAIISPQHKGGSRQNPANYRPVSLTSVVCKVMERLITRRMQTYLERAGLLSKSQHGFR